MATRAVPVTFPLDLRATLRPLAMHWSQVTPDGWWRSLRTPEGPATLRLRRSDEERVEATAWGRGSGWILDRVPDWLGVHDAPEALTTDHPVVGPLHRRALGVRYGRTGLVFEAVLSAVVGQRVTGKEAARSLRALTRRYSEPAPGPMALSLPPDAERLADQPYHALHDLGIEKKRADTLIRLAQRRRLLERLGEASSAEAGRVLAAFPGVGAWTVAETTALSHGDADAVSVGDFHLKHVVSWHLAGEPRGSDRRMLELLEEFRPHRGRVVRLLERSGGYPRYGPRAPIQSIAGI